MYSSLVTIGFIAILILSGGGVTVAAQSSQPNQPLYGLKVLSEDVRLGLSADSQISYRYALEFANRRAEEIQRLLQCGNIPPEPVQLRYQNQIDQALQYALDLPSDQASQALSEIQARLQTDLRVFNHLHASGSRSEAVLGQVRAMLQERQLWIEQGLANPTQLRDQIRLRKQQNQDPQTNPTQVSAGTGGGNLSMTGTPTSGSGHGPGDCAACTPDQRGSGGNPWTTGTPTPGSGYGLGPDPTRPQATNPGTVPGHQPHHPTANSPADPGRPSTDQKAGVPSNSSH